MKDQLTKSLFLVLCLCFSLSITAQKSSSLTPESLTFSDASNFFAGAFFNLGGINIQNGFNGTSITDNSVSTGSDLLRSKIDGSGFTIEDFAVLPGSKGNLNRKELTFVTSGQGAIGLDEETWTMGITDVGSFDGSDPVQSAFFLEYARIIDDVAIFRPIFFVNPDEGNMGMGTFSQNYNAQLYVEEFGEDQIAVSANNNSVTNATRWGVYSIAQGSGSGVRYGVVGQAFTSTGAKYGVLGTASSSGGGYAVYASGNLAYTGTITDVSDRKFKKNIAEFTALDRVMQLQPKTFEMKKEDFKRMNLAEGKRFGFIAQELQEIFPELVHRQVDATPFQQGDSLAVEQIDYLGVEYISMVPILTQAMQEQQKMIEEKDERITKLERQNLAMQRQNEELEDRLDQLEVLMQQLSQNTDSSGNTNTATVRGARLQQNQPNPFGNSTSIPHFIPNSVQTAELRITDAQGRVLKTIIVPNRGDGKTILETDQLSNGVYFYTLVLDGKVLDTRKMVSEK